MSDLDYASYKNAYNKKKMELNVQSSKSIVVIKNSMELRSDYRYSIWLNDEKLKFFPRIVERNQYRLNPKKYDIEKYYKVIEVPIKNIEYFDILGEQYKEQKISGGGGSGYSISGAVLGGLVAGATGAIIGSRKKINEIKSELINHDERRTVLKLRKNSIEMDASAHDILNKLIPEKERSIVSELQKQNILIEKQQSHLTQNTITIPEQIEKLFELKNDGILTDDEFNVKKQELLKRL